jgi:hypothetical protein
VADYPASKVTSLGVTTLLDGSKGYSISADVSPSPSPKRVTGYYTSLDYSATIILMLKVYGVFL